MLFKKRLVFLWMVVIVTIISFSFSSTDVNNSYKATYIQRLNDFKSCQLSLLATIRNSDINSAADIEKIKAEIQICRNKLKESDFWFRYMEPTMYKRLNGPLPVEWETEVFEKIEKPYKREGAGLTLAALYLDEDSIAKDSLYSLIQHSVDALDTYCADSITNELNTYHHFYLCNRLFLLNLAAIYTTGFECPDTAQIIPELRLILSSVSKIYESFNADYAATPLSDEYLTLYAKAITFVNSQPSDYTHFNHFSFIKDYVNPLFILNQKLILQHKVVSHSLIDFSLNKSAQSIFDKSLYYGQNTKGIFIRVQDPEAIAEIDRLGKLLFYDPILSGNNKRSCASCHKSSSCFTDTGVITSMHFNHKDFLPRNTPSLINAQYNHLLMLDGKHISLQNQGRDVTTNPAEMGSTEKELLEKVLSCSEYKKGFTKLLKYTPQETEITFDHVVSAISFYYAKFSKYYSPFDNAVNTNQYLDREAILGFNLFMSKAQCATCHFVPQFNGVKPPYISSEFEVLGVPGDTLYKKLSDDKGRYSVNPANETLHAFRTGTIRNAEHTAPYMHNGIFKNLNQVIDFYDEGGGIGKGLKVPNQTLSSDSLKLSIPEKKQLLSFIQSLNENIPFETQPEKLPVSKRKTLNTRIVGGEY